MVANKALIFLAAPSGWPVPGEHLGVQDIGFDADAAPPSGGLTLEINYVSFDPYLRGRMRLPEAKSYNTPFTLGKPFESIAVATILKSARDGFAAGEVVRGFMPIAQYASLDAKVAVEKLHNPHKLDARYFIGPLGMPGLTAFSSLYEIGQPKKGETIFISAASGAVGQIVGQLAKHEGLKVVGSVGSQAKLDYITKELGFDGGFNYKEEQPGEALKRLAPEGIDIYYENVGGVQLEAAIEAARDHARFVMCGAISEYSTPPEKRYGVKNLYLTVSKRLRLEGFIVLDKNFGPKWGKEHLTKVADWIADGSFKVSLSETKGIDNAAEGFVGLLKGENFGKALLEVKPF